MSEIILLQVYLHNVSLDSHSLYLMLCDEIRSNKLNEIVIEDLVAYWKAYDN